MPENEKTASGAPFQPPPANLWNDMVDAGRAYGQSRIGGLSDERTFPRSGDVVKVRNSTGGDLVRGDSICIDDFELTDIEPAFLWFDGAQATSANKPYGILIEDIPDDEIGRVQMSGVCFAKIDNDYADHPYAHPVAGEDHLSTNWYGHARILCRKEFPASSGQYWAAVLLGHFQSELLEVETAAAISGNSTGSADVWWNGAVTSPLQQITVHHKWLGTGSTIADNTKLLVRFDRRLNQWRPIAEDCA